MENQVVKIGTRESQLALIQTNSVLNKLKEIHPKVTFEVLPMVTKGDQVLDKALSKIGDRALFTKELEIALADKVVDLVVHSLKDLPTKLPDNMVIGAICKREDPADAVVFHPKHKDVKHLEELCKGSVVGTSSVRRIAQLKKNFPHLDFKDIRGNLNTRFRKLDTDDTYDAIVLAVAGISRMGWQDRIKQILKHDECLHAVGQGALAIECRADDFSMLRFISPLEHKETLLTCLAERSFMRALEGGCSVPIGVSSEIKEEQFILTGGVFCPEGSKSVVDTISWQKNENLNIDVANGNSENPSKKKRSDYSNINYVGVVSTKITPNEMKAAEDAGVQLAAKIDDAGGRAILTDLKATADKN